MMNNRRCNAAEPPVIHHLAANAARNELINKSQNENSTEYITNY
jgi:hypothetical protein